MEKKYDVSIHFTLKGQTIEQIEKKLDYWLDSEEYKEQFDFSQRDGFVCENVWKHTEPRSVLHHCFLPRKIVEQKNLPSDVWYFLEMISEDIVCWNGVWNNGDALCCDRLIMLENIKKLNGLSLFIGDIIDGVKDEYDIATRLGIDIIIIK